MISPADQMSAASPFSYACTRCSRCCQNKRIQVNPYEIARLARARGMTSAAAREAFTADNALLRDADERCIFLGEQGCGVHADRPLVCRLFPLGRMVQADGSETYRETGRNLGRGDFGTAGTVQDFLDSQGAAPFMAAADAYFAWFIRARERLSAMAGADEGAEAPDLLDMDGQIAGWCAAKGEAEPEDIEARLALHLAILDTHLEGDDHG